jgi:single-stranded-DNA-specific exonuclease
MIKSRNIFSDSEIELSHNLARDVDLPNEIALLLVKQGIRNKEEAHFFFNPKYDDLHNPMLMKNMEQSVVRINEAIDKNQKITIFCDYDVDGTSACSILFLYFMSINVNIDYYTPDRNNDGYGMNLTAVETIIKSGTNLVITVDCGITNNEEVDMLEKSGVDVIITDHHECGETLPNTEYILNPKQYDCNYPYEYLSGAGIAFKLIQGLCGKNAMDYIDYAALGTIADIVSLTGENRAIAKLGLEKMNNNISCGINLLRPYVLPDKKQIDEYHIGFGFGPRINAAGRMDTAHLALTALLATKPTEQAKKAAAKLDKLNEMRKSMCEEIIMQAEEQIFSKNMLSEPSAIFVMGDWEPGIVGICASRLTKKYSRPVLIFAKKGDEAVCSARSIEAVNIYDVLNNFSDYYIKFGGHHMAAGLTIKEKDFNELKDKVNKHILEQYRENIFIPKATYDIELKGEKLDEKFAKGIKKLAPYGQENPKPKFLFRDVIIKEKNYFGKQVKAHFKFNIKNQGKPLSAVKFYFSKKDDSIKTADIIGSVNISDFTGNPEIFIDYLESASIDGSMPKPIFAIEKTIDNIVEAYDNYETKINNSLLLNDAVTYIKNMTQRSRFGFCVIIDDEFKFDLLINNEEIKKIILEGKICFKLEDEYNIPLNSIGFLNKPEKLIKPFKEIVVFNKSNFSKNIKNKKLKAFIVKEVLKKYKLNAKEYFPNKEDMTKIFVVLKSLFESKQKFKSFEELYNVITNKTGLSIKKVISGVKILDELNLIDFEKSDIIIGKIVNHNEKKDLEASKIYFALKEF